MNNIDVKIQHCQNLISGVIDADMYTKDSIAHSLRNIVDVEYIKVKYEELEGLRKEKLQQELGE